MDARVGATRWESGPDGVESMGQLEQRTWRAELTVSSDPYFTPTDSQPHHCRQEPTWTTLMLMAIPLSRGLCWALRLLMLWVFPAPSPVLTLRQWLGLSPVFSGIPCQWSAASSMLPVPSMFWVSYRFLRSPWDLSLVLCHLTWRRGRCPLCSTSWPQTLLLPKKPSPWLPRPPAYSIHRLQCPSHLSALGPSHLILNDLTLV